MGWQGGCNPQTESASRRRLSTSSKGERSTVLPADARSQYHNNIICLGSDWCARRASHSCGFNDLSQCSKLCVTSSQPLDLVKIACKLREGHMANLNQDAIDAIELALGTLGCSQKEPALKLKVSPTQ